LLPLLALALSSAEEVGLSIDFAPCALILFLALALAALTRAASLALIQFYNPAYLEFNHHYTFVVIVYGIIFGLWIIWVNRLTTLKK
jgi:hypothetical protein